MENVGDKKIPCYGCPQRSWICHGSCERYHEWVAERKERNRKRYEKGEIRRYKIENYTPNRRR